MGKFIYLKFLSLFFLWIAACGTETETNSSESTYQTRPSSFVKTQNKPLDAQPETEANQGKSSLLLVSSVEFRGEDEEPEHTIYILEVENSGITLTNPPADENFNVQDDARLNLANPSRAFVNQWMPFPHGAGIPHGRHIPGQFSTPHGMGVPHNIGVPHGMGIPNGFGIPHGIGVPNGFGVPHGMGIPNGFGVPHGVTMFPAPAIWGNGRTAAPSWFETPASSWGARHPLMGPDIFSGRQPFPGGFNKPPEGNHLSGFGSEFFGTPFFLRNADGSPKVNDIKYWSVHDLKSQFPQTGIPEHTIVRNPMTVFRGMDGMNGKPLDDIFSNGIEAPHFHQAGSSVAQVNIQKHTATTENSAFVSTSKDINVANEFGRASQMRSGDQVRYIFEMEVPPGKGVDTELGVQHFSPTFAGRPIREVSVLA